MVPAGNPKIAAPGEQVPGEHKVAKKRRIAFREILPHHFRAVAAGIDHSQLGLALFECARQVSPGHSLRHDHIRKQEIDLAFMFVPNSKRFHTRTCLQHSILITQENFRYEFANLRLVFNQEDCFISTLDPLRSDSHFANGSFYWTGGGKIDSEGRALPRFTGDFDPALVLLDDAIDGCQSQTGAFANRFRREKRLKNAVECFLSIPQPVSDAVMQTKLPMRASGCCRV